MTVDPGKSFAYDYRLPDDHPPGVFWYHPHHHGLVADQIFGGLYGAIVVEDTQELPVTRERVLVLSDITLDASGRLQQPPTMARMSGREGQLVLVNGQVQPTLTARPGERERWRIVNACAARYVRLRLDGQPLDLLGIDSGRFGEPRRVEEVVLASGNRADLLVTATAGTTALQAQGVNRGSMAGMAGMAGLAGGSVSGDVGPVATFEVTGPVGGALPPLPAQPAPRDLRSAQLATRRRLVFVIGMGGGGATGMSGSGGSGSGGMGGGGMGGGGMGGMTFTIDGREFDAGRVDQAVTVGQVEEWTIANTSPMDHPVHLHVWPMQIVAEAGRPVADVRWQDVVNVPARSEVTVRIAFDTFGGRTVYHCHILDHEDNGMMGVVEARSPA